MRRAMSTSCDQRGMRSIRFFSASTAPGTCRTRTLSSTSTKGRRSFGDAASETRLEGAASDDDSACCRTCPMRPTSCSGSLSSASSVSHRNRRSSARDHSTTAAVFPYPGGATSTTSGVSARFRRARRRGRGTRPGGSAGGACRSRRNAGGQSALATSLTSVSSGIASWVALSLDAISIRSLDPLKAPPGHQGRGPASARKLAPPQSGCTGASSSPASDDAPDRFCRTFGS